MNSVSKFVSTDKFDYSQWSKDRAMQCVEDSVQKLARKGFVVTSEEKKTLANNLLNKKGMTFHFYFAGNITERDIKDIRPKKVDDQKTPDQQPVK